MANPSMFRTLMKILVTSCFYSYKDVWDHQYPILMSHAVRRMSLQACIFCEHNCRRLSRYVVYTGSKQYTENESGSRCHVTYVFSY